MEKNKKNVEQEDGVPKRSSIKKKKKEEQTEEESTIISAKKMEDEQNSEDKTDSPRRSSVKSAKKSKDVVDDAKTGIVEPETQENIKTNAISSSSDNDQLITPDEIYTPEDRASKKATSTKTKPGEPETSVPIPDGDEEKSLKEKNTPKDTKNKLDNHSESPSKPSDNIVQVSIPEEDKSTLSVIELDIDSKGLERRRSSAVPTQVNIC